MPVAVVHVVPPSVDTSTLATCPLPLSLAVPLIVVGVPLMTVAPDAGEVIVEVGGVVSGVPGTSPGCSDPG